jgi:hypothetical protein
MRRSQGWNGSLARAYRLARDRSDALKLVIQAKARRGFPAGRKSPVSIS